MVELARAAMRPLFLIASLLVAAITVAQMQKASGVADFISVDTPVFVLEHVRVIDGTGTPAEDQAVVIANGKIHCRNPLHGAATLSGGWGDRNAHDRKPGADSTEC
jgi:hypothetical protein